MSAQVSRFMPTRARVVVIAAVALVIGGAIAWASMPQPGGAHTVTSSRAYDSQNNVTTVTYKLHVAYGGAVKDFHLVLPDGQTLPKNAATGSNAGSTTFNQGTIDSNNTSVHWVASSYAPEGDVEFTISVPGNVHPEGKGPYWAATSDGNATTVRTLAHIKKKDAVVGWGPGTGGGPDQDPENGPLIPPPGVQFSSIEHDGEAPIGGDLVISLSSTDAGADYALYISLDVVPDSTLLPLGLTLQNGTGTLDPSGEATATLHVPNDPSLAGKVVYATLVTFGTTGEQNIVSTPSEITID